MSIDIGRVFSNTWEMIKQRFWLLLALWAVFFAVQIVFSIVFTIVGGGSIAALGAAAGGGGDAALLGGLGIGAILLMIVFYVAYILIALAQQCSMSEMASPLDKPEFGQAFTNGFRAAPTLLGLFALLIAAYIGFAIVGLIVGFILAFLGDIGGLLFGLLAFAAIIYFAVRLSVIIPVIAVDKVRNPITAITKTWNMTAGKFLPILVIYLIMIGVALLVVGLPVFLMLGSIGAMAMGGDPAAAGGAIMGVLGGFFLIFPLFIIFSIFSVTLVSCLHAEVTDSTAEKAQDTFS
ncbi:glycerophosphoryl diester phosphodiesterase membrane domain-containing protein [uncultured Erythrobacter sp.]|uniref:glycerophosphoryl diester phosphodiesterase membrane domain-containing protein n=1 Tax=uncultured Erythrobacter sp. TaxID=263913 RepID=UPI00262D4BF4|nr:glycerophosphoryl diester phosphodiesterase membrane domain-containing protein [uncultured Erythrobacter sp.]